MSETIQPKTSRFKLINEYLSGYGAVLIGIAVLIQQYRLAQQEQTVKDFNSLIKTESKVLNSLNTTVGILDRQLNISESIQKDYLKNHTLQNKASINELWVACEGLINLKRDWTGKSNDTLRAKSENLYLQGAMEILKGQRNNPFLLENDTLSNQWLEALKNMAVTSRIEVGEFMFEKEDWLNIECNSLCSLEYNICMYCSNANPEIPPPSKKIIVKSN